MQETQRLARDPYLADRFRDGIDKAEGDFFRTFDLTRFADRVSLRPLERLILASSFVAAPSTRETLKIQAANCIRVEFDEAVMALCHNPSFDHADLAPNQATKLMTNLLCDAQARYLDGHQKQALIAAAYAKYGSEIMAPIMQQRIIPNLRYVRAHSVDSQERS